MSTRTEVADVLVIGGGTSGGIVTRHLAEAGYRVVVLEQGTWPDPSKMPGGLPEYELLGAKQWSPNPNVRGLPADYPVNDSDSATPMIMYNGVGGSSVMWAGCWIRALPSDFRVRTLDGVADDWPLTYEELAPYYDAVDQEIGAAVRPGNPAYPPGSAPAPMSAHPINPGGRRMAEAMNRLGWHWWTGANGIPTRNFGAQHQCERLGVCRMGCPVGAKFSTNITHFPVALKRNAEIITGARVSEITLDERGRANGAVYVQDGKERFQPASVVVMAANGVGTPRLMLMSTSARFPDGIANSSGLVGKRLMTHPYGTAVGIYDDFLEDWLGPVGEVMQSMQFYETDTSRGFVRGAKWHIMGTGGPLAMVGRLKGEGFHATGQAGPAAEPRVGSAEGAVPADFWGESFCARLSESVGHMIEWVAIPDDLPEESNCVTLDPDLTDSDGLPAPAIHYQVSENTDRIINFNLERQMEAHLEAGAKKVWVTNRRNPSGHLLGTTKMGDDPGTSVVDRYGRTHDVPNLFVVDGSVFTTATGVNPTATICALAKRTATHMVARAKEQVIAS
jgi:choline dehydrogenase-like flavoprotein